MYFKRLELIGFKSFLEKIKLKFEPGVTAIVGPNGCGKSNIVDAIKWVLGEQSTRAMRSTSMEDVIFSGTENQEPVNMAEVSLTLSNEDKVLPIDYDEVVISRRLYRSGESEYLINKMPVRLTDVRNLIMGTGIGTSAYSIVEQGKMDMIISSKPEDRRYVFEEASGITRYKTKKREAVLKLERTQENLVRINDITREIERQINSIERQARRAERYKARFEELKGLEIKKADKSLKELAASDDAINKEELCLKELLERLGSELKESSDLLSRLREEYGAHLEEMQTYENKVMRLTTDIDKNKHVIIVNQERIGELEKQVECLDWEIEKETERRENLRTRVEELETKFKDVNRICQEKDKELVSFGEELRRINGECETAKDSLKQKREKSVDLVSLETKSKNSLIKTNADIQNVQARIKRLRLEKEKVQREKEKIIEGLKGIEEVCSIVRLELEKTKGVFNVFNDEYVRKQGRIADLNGKRREKESRLNEIRPRRQFLERLLSEREGIKDTVKDIMRRTEAGDSRFKGVHGIFSELINIKEGYSESIEAILGDAAQSIVVETKGVMENVTAYLKESAGGSVNFIILDELAGLLQEGAEGVAAEGAEGGTKVEDLDSLTNILIAKEPYCSTLRVLLYDVYITASQETAEKFMQETSDFYGCIIGEKGEVYQKGMRRSRSHSQKEFIPLFGRREKVQELSKEEERIAGEIELLNKDISTLEEWVKGSISQKESLEAQLREREIEFAEVSSRKNAALEKSNSFSEEIVLLESEIKEEEDNIKALEGERQRLVQALKALEEEGIRLEDEINNAQKDIQDCTRKREETFFGMSDVKAELSGLKKEEENLAENVERERDSHKRIEEALENKRNQIKENGERIKALNEEKGKLEGCNIEYSSSLELAKKEALERKTQKQGLVEKMRREESFAKSKEENLEEVKNKLRDFDIKKKELEYKQSALVERILNAYKINILEFKLELDENASWGEIEARIDELKGELNKMGDVSLGAALEHKELVERYDFLVKQRDDLVKGKETLMEAITKINRTTRQLFIETFENIRREFNNYFRMLFNGGKAELVLMDESDILECGIDVVVRPPGKKLHNIMQLSGGEKAMTAIALIFAIFKVVPSPFCILDEIDAPLDESNIVRFCRVLQEFLKTSQFVIVTHNRTTIQLADVLYGITMQDKGISRIVSVKFAEDKAAADQETVPTAA